MVFWNGIGISFKSKEGHFSIVDYWKFFRLSFISTVKNWGKRSNFERIDLTVDTGDPKCLVDHMKRQGTER